VNSLPNTSAGRLFVTNFCGPFLSGDRGFDSVNVFSPRPEHSDLISRGFSCRKIDHFQSNFVNFRGRLDICVFLLFFNEEKDSNSSICSFEAPRPRQLRYKASFCLLAGHLQQNGLEWSFRSIRLIIR